MDYKKGIDRHQLVLFNECIDNLVDKNNPVRIIDAYVESLSLKKMGFNTPAMKTGTTPYSNKLLLKIYMYAYMNKIRGSRPIVRECKRNKEMIWLTEGLAPCFKTISDFRNKNRKGIKNIFKEFLLFCHELELLSFEIVAIDGTKLRAQNSTNNIYTRKEIDNVKLRIEKKITEYLAILDEEDKKEGDLELKEDQVEKILKRLDNARKHCDKVDRIKEKFEKDQELEKVFETDPDSRFQSDKGKVRSGYNPQLAGDSKHNLLIANDVTNQSNDLNQMTPMIKKINDIKEGLEVSKKTNALFDSGYFNEVEIMRNKDDDQINILVPSVAQAKESNNKCRSKQSKLKTPRRGFEKSNFTYNPEENTYTCPRGKVLLQKGKTPRSKPSGVLMVEYQCKQCNNCVDKPKCTTNKIGRSIQVSVNHYEMKSFMKKMEAETNKYIYSQRKEIIEHPFGTLKRHWGYTYFMQKGLDKVKSEFSFMCFIYNFKRVMNILTVEKMIEAING